MDFQKIRRPAFTLVELVVVVLILGILGSVVAGTVWQQHQDATIMALRESLRAIQDAIETQTAITGSYPATVEPTWFRGNRLPRHPLLSGSAVPNIHVFSGDNRTHPQHKTLDQLGAYWYNPNVGIVRARVPTGTAAQVLANYNLINDSALTSLNQMYD